MNELKPCPTPRTDTNRFTVLSRLQSGTEEVVLAIISKTIEQELIATQLELQKWKDGCLVNADNAKDALRRSDELRLDLRGTQAAHQECVDIIKWLYENTSHCYPLEYDRRITKALSNPLTQQAMKGK